jgi:hypothetical protein
MRISNWHKVVMGCLAVAGMAGAHLFTDGLAPGASDVLKVGDSFTITWKVQFPHNKGTDIAVSTDGGNTWTDIKKGYSEVSGANSFKWTVAGPATTKAKIRICEQADSPKPCTDADKVSDPTSGTGGHYVLVTPAFTIAEAGSAVRGASPAAPFSLDYRAEARSVDVAFTLDAAREVSLQAFDPQGRLVATLAQGRFGAGAHRFSAFSNRIAAAGALVFQLRLGEEAHSLAWSRP